jgi:hypothetical protein
VRSNAAGVLYGDGVRAAGVHAATSLAVLSEEGVCSGLGSNRAPASLVLIAFLESGCILTRSSFHAHRHRRKLRWPVGAFHPTIHLLPGQTPKRGGWGWSCLALTTGPALLFALIPLPAVFASPVTIGIR